jgi:hypothetical protein
VQIAASQVFLDHFVHNRQKEPILLLAMLVIESVDVTPLLFNDLRDAWLPLSVTPAKAGVRKSSQDEDSGFRWNDENSHSVSFYQTINRDPLKLFAFIFRATVK